MWRHPARHITYRCWAAPAAPFPLSICDASHPPLSLSRRRSAAPRCSGADQAARPTSASLAPPPARVHATARPIRLPWPLIAGRRIAALAGRVIPGIPPPTLLRSAKLLQRGERVSYRKAGRDQLRGRMERGAPRRHKVAGLPCRRVERGTGRRCRRPTAVLHHRWRRRRCTRRRSRLRRRAWVLWSRPLRLLLHLLELEARLKASVLRRPLPRRRRHRRRVRRSWRLQLGGRAPPARQLARSVP